MDRSFTTPAEFLAYLQRTLAKPVPPGDADPAFEHAVRTRNTDLDFGAFEGPTRGLEMTVSMLKEAIFPALPVTDRERVERSIAIGVLDIGSVNARIVRGGTAIYAVIVHSGLMLLLHKTFKFIQAAAELQEVEYCSRKAAKELTSDDCISFMLETTQNTVTYGAPHGPLMHLSPRAAALAGGHLYVAELFILAHELGHFLNGDLETRANFRAVAGEPGLEEYIENASHRKEFEADARAFEIILAVHRQADDKAIAFVPPLVTLFNTLYLLCGGESGHLHIHSNEASHS